MYLLTFLFSSLYTSEHLSFASSSPVPNTSFQASSFLLTVAFTWSFHHTLLGSHLLLAMIHALLLHFQPFLFHLLSHVLDIVISIPFYSLPLKRSSIFFSVLMFPEFLTSNPPCCIHYFSPLNPCPYQPDFTQYNIVIWDALSHSSHYPHILYKTQHALLHQHQVYHALYFHSILVPCHPCVLMQILALEYVLPTHCPLSAQN